ncbi:MAG: SH3 domain-containing protein [Burkholderiaceae bacterium]
MSQMTLATADAVEAERLALPVDGVGKAISQRVNANQKQRYALTVEEGHTLSVDLLSQGPDVQFNILPVDSDFPIHASSLDGRVADIVVPESGDYVVDVFLAPDAGQADQTQSSGRALVTIAVYSPDRSETLLDGPDFWAVNGLKVGAALNLRAGPSTRYQAVGQLENGVALQNNGCRLTQGKRWCFVRVPSLETVGWVAARFLIEGSAP